MPEVNIAPSPVAVPVPAAASGAPAEETAGPAAEAGAEQPFAAALQHEVERQTGAVAESATKDAAALVAANAESPPPAVEAPADAISLLAPMLAGIVPPPPMPKQAATEGDAATTDAPVLASPVIAALPPASTPALPAEQTAEARPAVQAAVAGNIQAGSAILAGEEVQGRSNHADSGKATGKEGFESLLAAAKELPPMAAAHAAERPLAPAPAAARVETPVGAPGWDTEIGQKVVWMANRQESRAELVLNPPQLGRVEISLSLNGDQATATFVSASPAVREALENAVPRLREILLDAGVTLGQTQVGAESFSQQANQGEKGHNSSRSARQGQDFDAMPASLGAANPAVWQRSGNGLVDIFA